jgi:hypothetical protein
MARQARFGGLIKVIHPKYYSNEFCIFLTLGKLGRQCTVVMGALKMIWTFLALIGAYVMRI